METLKAFKQAVEENTDLAQEYAKKEIEQVKLSAFYQLSSFSVGAAKILLFGAIALLSSLFATLALAFYLGELLESDAIGFLIISGGYIVLAGIVYLIRSHIEKFIVGYLSKHYFQDD